MQVFVDHPLNFIGEVIIKGSPEAVFIGIVVDVHGYIVIVKAGAEGNHNKKDEGCIQEISLFHWLYFTVLAVRTC